MLQSVLKELQQVATRGSGVSKSEGDKVYRAENKATSLLQPGSSTSDVAATFTSHATGRTGEKGYAIFAKDADENCKNEKCGKTRREVEMMKAQMKTIQNRKPKPERLCTLRNHHMSRHSEFCSCTLKMTVVDDVSSVSVWTFVAQRIICGNINKWCDVM